MNEKAFCDSCQLGKSHLLPFNLSKSHATSPLEIIHTEIWRPAPLSSPSGFRYYVVFIDEFSRYTWLYPLRQKSDLLQTFNQFKTLVENQLTKKIKIIQSDMGGEYISLTKILETSGIHARFSCPFTSAQNRRAERKHQPITETGLTLLAESKVHLKY